MITIQTVMLVALGFLLASLLALALAPAYWARAVRLTRRHISRTMPVTEAEIRADKDRLRAEYAVRIHNLESTLEKSRLSAARQQVEVNRRDANISGLETELVQLRTDLEQNVNARRVLEQTVMDRLPAVEQRLADSRTLLEQRDRELAAVTAETGKTVRALDEVMQINAQQRAEIERLNATVSTRAARNRGSLQDSKFDGEVALRSELEALRAKARDQETLIGRLQTLVTEPADAVHGPLQVPRANGADRPQNGDAELARVRRDLAEAEQALRQVSEQTAAAGAGEAAAESAFSALKATISEQDATIRRLEAALAAYQQGEAATRSISLKDSKIAMKARISSLQSEVDSHTETIQRLRAELAAANERAALQTAQFVDEMRRMGGTNGSGGAGKRPAVGALRRSLADRIGEAKPALANSIKTVTRPGEDHAQANGNDTPLTATTAVSETATEPASSSVVAIAQQDSKEPAATKVVESATMNGTTNGVAPHSRAVGDIEPKPRLLDRIASLSKS